MDVSSFVWNYLLSLVEEKWKIYRNNLLTHNIFEWFAPKMQNNERNVLKMANFLWFVWQNFLLTHINQISERNIVIFVTLYIFLKDLSVANSKRSSLNSWKVHLFVIRNKKYGSLDLVVKCPVVAFHSH